MRDERIARILAAEEASVQVSRIGWIAVWAQKLAWESQFRSSGGGTRSAPDIPIGDKQSNTVTIAVSQ
jgi:hypothetical protein